jgi:hypothetical protein
VCWLGPVDRDVLMICTWPLPAAIGQARELLLDSESGESSA